MVVVTRLVTISLEAITVAVTVDIGWALTSIHAMVTKINTEHASHEM